MPDVKLRFVTSNSPISDMIRLQAGICMPFTPSHVEALSRDEKSYIGAHLNGGIAARPIGYDADRDGLKEAIVSVPMTAAGYAAFHDYVESKIGLPYDWKAIASFAAPNVNMHEFGHLICSAFMALALRAPGCEFFPWPLTVPAHHISPRDLFLVLSTHVEIDH